MNNRMPQPVLKQQTQNRLLRFVSIISLFTLLIQMTGLGFVIQPGIAQAVEASPSANPSADLDQCANGSLASPNSPACDPDEWVNGNLGASKAHYFEDDSVPYRMRFENLSLASHTVTIEWDTAKGGKHALDYLTSYDRTVTTANPCDDVTGCGAFTTFPIPADAQVTGGGVTPIAGNFTLFGGTISAASAYSYPDGIGFSGDKSAQITLTFTPTVTNPVLAWGGHIASRADWGAENSAIGIPGSPYHMRLIGLDGSGGNQDRSLSTEAVIFPGSVTIVKAASPEGATSFPYTTNLGSGFSLVDDGTSANTKVFSDITDFTDDNSGPTTYTVTESAAPGWVLDSILCVDPTSNSTGNTGTRTATIEMVEGENITCTFANSADVGSLTVNKKVDADANGTFEGGNTEANTLGFDWGLDAEVPARDMGTTANAISSGLHGVTEDAVNGYHFVGWFPTGSTQYSCAIPQGTTLPASVNVPKDGTASITLCNARDTGNLVVIKQDAGLNRQAGVEFEIDGQTYFTNGNGEISVNGLLTGAHSAEEIVSPPGFSFSSVSGANCTNANPTTATINASQTTTCTFTNVRDTGTLTVRKNVDTDGDGDIDVTNATNWSWDIANGEQNIATGQSRVLPTATYTISEDMVAGYHVTNLTCDGQSLGTVTSGQITITKNGQHLCTFTNTRDTGRVTFEKIVSGGSAIPANWAFAVNGVGTFNHGQSVSLPTGSYNVTENGPANYTNTNVSGICSGQNGSGTLTVTTQGGTCTFTNTRDTGNITVNKYFDDNGDGQIDRTNPQGWTWDIVNGSQNNLGGATVQLNTGSYTVTEDALANYHATWTCNNQNSGNGMSFPATVVKNQNLVCSFTNTHDTGTITVLKNVDTNGDGQIDVVGSIDWTWDIGSGPQNTPTGSSQTVRTGSYTISEDQQPNYHVTDLTCNGESRGAVTTAQITVTTQGVVCTFTNTRDTASITVNKFVHQPGQDPTYNPANWSWSLNAESGIAAGSTRTLLTNTSYTVTEDTSIYTTDNYNTTWACLDGTAPFAQGVGTSFQISVPNNGQSIVCTFTNIRKTGTIAVNKYFDDNGDGQIDRTNPQGWTWDIVNGTQNTAGGATVLLATGPYTIIEDAIADYHTTWTCSNQTSGTGQSFGVTVNEDDAIVCSFTNTHDTGSITGTKFNDLDGDGIWDAGEPGVQNVTINLTGGMNSSRVTDANGNYSFLGVPTGNYSVSEVLPAGWVNTTPTSVPVTLDGQGDSATVNFGNFRLISISGQKFNDLDGDGIKDAGEPGLGNWTINLDRGANGSVDGNTTTDGNGNYTFPNLGPGTYRIREVQKAGWTQTTVNPSDVVASSGINVSGVNFGNFQLGTISGYKYNDVNGNGFWDQGEPTLGGWTIRLNGSTTDVTDGNGFYEFTSLSAGSYTLTEDLQTGWTQTDAPAAVVVTSGTVSEHNDFGNFRLGRITGFKYDNLENPLDGWQICLAEQISDQVSINGGQNCVFSGAGEWPDGYYEFPGLFAGTYMVSEEDRFGWTQLSPLEPNYHMVVVTSGTGYESEPNQYNFVNRLNDFDVTIDKVAEETVQAGNQLTYTLNWSVTGNIPVENAMITDSVPANTSFVSASNGGAENSGVVTWNLGTKNPGDNGSVTMTVTVNTPLPNGTVIENIAEFCAEGDLVVQTLVQSAPLGEDTDPLTEKCDDDTTTTTVESDFTVSIEKTDAIDPVQAGGQISYTLDWSVSGNAPIDTLVITDVIPSNTTFVSASNSGTYDTTTKIVTWDLGSHIPGDIGSVTLVVQTNSPLANGTTITNIAEICGTSFTRTQEEVIEHCDDGDETTTIQSAATLSISKTDSPDPIAPGGTLIYTINWSVAGNSPVTNLVLTDTLPTDVTFVSATIGGTHNGTNPGGIVTWNFGNQLPGANGTVTVTVTVSNSLSNGATFTNTASLDADETTPVSDTEATTVVAAPILGITKSVNLTFANPGDTATYTVTIKNTGNDAAVNLVLTDTLPAGFTFVDGGGTTKVFTLGNLAKGASTTVTYNIIIATTQAAGFYDNNAVAKADNHGPVSAKATLEVRLPVVLASLPTPVLVLEKTVSQAVANPGNTISYVVTISNDGNEAATNVRLNDTLPEGFTFVDTGSNARTWMIGTLLSGEVRTFTYEVRIPDNATAGMKENIVVATADNHKSLQAIAPVETRVPEVKGALVTTGASTRDYALFFLGALYLVLGALGLRKTRDLAKEGQS